MTLDEILDQWDSDVGTNELALDEDSLKIPKLHAKYLRYYAKENLQLAMEQAEYKTYRQAKNDFLVYGVDSAEEAKLWTLPPKGKILKSEIEGFLDADPDIIKKSLRVSYQREKVNTLKSIIDMINNRSYQINSAISFKRWASGN